MASIFMVSDKTNSSICKKVWDVKSSSWLRSQPCTKDWSASVRSFEVFKRCWLALWYVQKNFLLHFYLVALFIVTIC